MTLGFILSQFFCRTARQIGTEEARQQRRRDVQVGPWDPASCYFIALTTTKPVVIGAFWSCQVTRQVYSGIIQIPGKRFFFFFNGNRDDVHRVCCVFCVLHSTSHQAGPRVWISAEGERLMFYLGVRLKLSDPSCPPVAVQCRETLLCNFQQPCATNNVSKDSLLPGF